MREREKERGRVGRWIKRKREGKKKKDTHENKKREECGVLL